jgi:hypothetical protein
LVLKRIYMPAIALKVQEEMQCVQKMGEGGSKEGKEGQSYTTEVVPSFAEAVVHR